MPLGMSKSRVALLFLWRESEVETIWPRRLFALDLSRAVAAFFVVLWHWSHFYFVGDHLPKTFRYSHEPLASFLKIPYEKGGWAVDYFFLLSGFVFFWLCRDAISGRKMSARTFALQRFSRLYPLHLLTLGLVAGLQALHVHQTGALFVFGHMDWKHLLMNLGFVQSWGFEEGASFNGPAWSISVEVFLYVVFFVLAWRKRATATMCIVLSVVAFLCWNQTWSLLPRGAASFFLGGAVHALLGSLLRKPRAIRRWIHCATILSWVAILVDIHVYRLSGSIIRISGGRILLYAYPVYVLFPLTLCSLVLFEIERGPVFERVAWIGNLTYSSYLLHFPMQIAVVLCIGAGLLPDGVFGSPAGLVAFLALLVVVSHWTYVAFEHPAQDWLRDVFCRRKRLAPESEPRDGAPSGE